MTRAKCTLKSSRRTGGVTWTSVDNDGAKAVLKDKSFYKYYREPNSFIVTFGSIERGTWDVCGEQRACFFLLDKRMTPTSPLQTVLLYREGVAWRSESLNISDMPSLFGRKLKHPVNCVAEHFHAKGKSMILLPDADVGWADRPQCHDFADEVAVVQTCPEKCGALWSSATQLMRGIKMLDFTEENSFEEIYDC